MAYTNKTTNYELPQYVSTDKPTYLVDFNKAMRTIDSTMKTNATNIETNATNITVASNKVGDLSTLETTAKTDAVSAINEVNSNIGDLTDLNTTDKTSTVNAINEVLSQFNFTSFTTYKPGDTTMRVSTGTLIGNYGFTVATNADKTICKIYGDTTVTGVTPNNHFYVELDTDFNIDEEFTVDHCGIALVEPNYNTINYPIYITFLTNGKVRIYGMSTNEKAWFCAFPIIIFVKNFGDEPRPDTI